MADTDEVLSKLNKTTRKRIRKANETEIVRLPLASVGLTAALGGGIGLGRQTLIWGSKSAGKTALIMQSMALWQQMGYVCALVDVEGTFDKDWSARLGVDNKKLLLSSSKLTDEVVEDVTDFMQSGVDIVLVDSITSLIPLSWVEKNGKELKGLSGTNQIGGQAVDIARALKLLHGANEKTSLILISQTRNKITTYGAIPEPTGGQAVAFYSTTSVRLTAQKSDKEQIKRSVDVNGKLIETNVGREVTFTVDYNKIGPPSRTGAYDFYYSGEEVGVDTVGEGVTLALALNIIKQGGAWFKYNGMQWQGKPAVVEYFHGNPDCFEELKMEIANG